MAASILDSSIPPEPARPESACSHVVPVDFQGEGSGAAPLSWGQSDIWQAMVRYDEAMPMGGVKPLPPGTTLAAIVDELRYLMIRYQVMRTRLSFAADGSPLQVVADAGVINLEIVDAAADDDPAEMAEAVAHRFTTTKFTYTKDWPVRIAVVRHRGALTHMAVIMHHLALDGFAGGVMMREVADREPAPVTGMQPLEQARWQESPAGIRQNEAALRYFEGVLRSLPSAWVGTPAQPRSPRHWEGEFDSAAMMQALQDIACRTGGDTAPALLAAFALAVHRSSGINPVALRPVVSNRFRPRLAEVVAPISQPSLCAIDVLTAAPEASGGPCTTIEPPVEAPFPELMERARRASMAAYKYAYYQPLAALAMVDRVVAERGLGFDVDCFFNDRRGTTTVVGADAAASLEVAPSTFRWTAAKDTPSARLFVQVDDLPGKIRLNIFADTHHISPEDAEALLRTMEKILVTAAADALVSP